ncbi:MAG: nickel pincer cofactor biosynthesis protein LarC [Cyanobacteria bacterium J06638_20]
MTKIAYFECPTGIAGDMCLGALVHAGVPLDYLRSHLKQVGVEDEFNLWAETVTRNGQAATKVHVDLLKGDGSEYATFAEAASHGHEPPVHASAQNTAAHEHGHHRHLPEIEQRIQAAGLPPRVEAWSLAVFRQMAAAEGAVHGIAPEKVHFHEVGATDAIVDIVGTCLGLDWLQLDRLYCSPLPTGGGTIRAAHGRLPVPAPAVLQLWQMRQVPVYSNGIEREMVTPTGAALMTTLAVDFGAPPTMRLQQVGLGAGSRDFAIPNILRLWIGESMAEGSSTHTHANVHTHTPQPTPATESSDRPQVETVTILETQVDDANPQAIAYTQQLLLEAGALDVFSQAIAMKKSRLGTLITAICHPEQANTCKAILFRETTTLGIRQSEQQRTILQRQIDSVETPFGTVRIKVARAQADQPILNAQPEYEDCAALARQHQQPWQDIYRTALQTWHTEKPGSAEIHE